MPPRRTHARKNTTRPLRSLTDLTWKDAILIEIASLEDRIRRDMPIGGASLNRLRAMIVEHWNPTVEARPK